MATSQASETAWLERLALWKASQRRGDTEQTYQLLVDLVELGEQLRAQRPDGRPSPTELRLLTQLGMQLQAREQHEHALRIYTCVRQYARDSNDRYTDVFLACRGVHSCISLLDLKSAQQALAQVLRFAEPDFPGYSGEQLASLASRISLPRVSAFDMHCLRTEALVALGSTLASVGRLRAADLVLREALALLARQDSPFVSADDVWIQLAEVKLDQGDFAGFEALRTLAHERTETAQFKWNVLLADLWCLQGRFSDANGLLGSLLDTSNTALDKELLAAARWHRCNVLAVLNRLDEAEALANQLERQSSSKAFDIAGLRRLLEARRLGANLSLGIHPTPRQVLLPSLMTDAPIALPSEDEAAAVRELCRQVPRIRHDYSRAFNHVLLALHHGHVDTAVLLVTHLKSWAGRIESDLIAARQHHLWALVAYYCEDWATAEGALREALSIYDRLGMPQDQWALLHIKGWLLTRKGAASSEVELNRQRTLERQHRVLSGLGPSDRALYLLNKWSTVDDRIAAVLEQSAARRSMRAWWPHIRSPSRDALHKLESCLALRRHFALQPADPGDARPQSAHPEGGADVYRLAGHRTRQAVRANDHSSVREHIPLAWLPSDTAVLHYIVLPDRVALFLLLRGSCQQVAIDSVATRPELWDKIRACLGYLYGSRPWRADAGHLRDLSAMLGLLDLAERLPSRVKHLAIVPEDMLSQAPFSALPVGTSPSIAQFSISILPDLYWSYRPTPRPPFRRALGVAIAAPGPDSSRYPPLEGSVDESRLCKQWGRKSWRLLTDETATVDAVKSALPEATIAHFACHGDFFPDDPDRSGLLLHDGWLTVRELRHMPLRKLKTIVLASCWGANSQTLPGNVHVGLPFAMLDQGVKGVVASLWEVPHAQNMELMQSLYGQSPGTTVAEALANAQRTQWEQGKLPVAWAGYQTFCDAIAPRWPFRWTLGLEMFVAALRRASWRPITATQQAS